MCLTEAEVGVLPSGVGTAGGWVLGSLCECWNLSLGPLEEHQVLLPAAPSLQTSSLVSVKPSYSPLPMGNAVFKNTVLWTQLHTEREGEIVHHIGLLL